MNNSQTDFNKHMFRLARNYRGITQSELAGRSKISQGVLSKIDHGLIIPNDQQLKEIASALDFPIEFFTQNAHDLPSGLVFHRKRVALKEKERARIESEVKLRLNCLKKLASQLDIDSNIETVDLNNYDNDPKKVATALRFRWKIPHGPINNVVNLLENNGIVIIRFDFGNELLDGFFILDDRPCIALNSRFPMERQRFTLCHELGHIVMHRMPDENMESEADAFASEFLMPSSEIREYFAHNKLNLQYLFSLKAYWRVSVAALIIKARDLGFITPSNVRRLYMQMNALQIRKKEPYPVPMENPCLVGEIINAYTEGLHYSVAEIQKLLFLNVNDYLRFFNPFQYNQAVQTT